MAAIVHAEGATDVVDRPARLLGEVTSTQLVDAVQAVVDALAVRATSTDIAAVVARLGAELTAAVTGTVSVTGLAALATEVTLAELRDRIDPLATDATVREVVDALAATLNVNTGLIQPLTDTQLRAAAVPVVDGHPDPQTDSLTDAQLRATAVPVTDGHPDPQTDGLTDTQLRATPLAVADGHVDPQTDGLTDAQLRAAPLDVADGHPDPQTDGLTDTQLRASAIDVGGVVQIVPLTTWTSRRVTLTTAAQEVTASSPLAGRKTITLKAATANNKAVFLGPDAAVSSASAQLNAGEVSILEVDATASVWCAGETNGQIVDVIEIA